jgi:pimeloyl-ACP methyl ester carboxylesterase
LPVCAGLNYTEYKPLKEDLPAGVEFQQPGVILLHGAGGSSLSWPVGIRRLAGYHVLALDLPGHGRSEGIVSQTIEGNCRALETFLRELGIFSLVLVGHSLGAAVAARFAQRNADQVRGLALLSAAPNLAVPADLFHAIADPETYPIGISLLKQRFFSPRTEPGLRDRILAPLQKQRSTVLYSDLLAASRAEFQIGADLASIPCWGACGRDDLVTPPTITRAFTERFDTFWFSEIPSAGHMLPLEQPEAVARGLQEFLTKINVLHPQLATVK